MGKTYIIGIIIREQTGLPPALAKLDAKEFRYPYHNFREINNNDNGLKSSIFFKGDGLLTSGRKKDVNELHPAASQRLFPQIIL